MLQACIKRGQSSRSYALFKTLLPFSESGSLAGHKFPEKHVLSRCIVTFSNLDLIASRRASTKERHLWRKYSIVTEPEKNNNRLVCCSNVGFSKRHFVIAKLGNKKESKKGVKLQVKATNGVANELHLDENEWQTVYRFKYIRLARVIQKLKIYQTDFTCLFAFPGSIGMYLYGVAPPEMVVFMLGSSMFACGMLYIMGRFCSRLIGVMYVSQYDPTLVNVAHLNFWGKREDKIVSKMDFKPFSELPDNVSDIYINVGLYSDPMEKLHMCVRYGTVYLKEDFEEIFGSESVLSISSKNDNK